jgi:molybdopterin/thiamine biosynthesis adenylyltransferase
MLTDEQIERYSRQIILPELGGRGQERLLSAAVALVGTGELGMSAALYLAAAGVGTLGVGTAVAAAIAGLNPDCRTRPLAAALGSDAALAIARDYDLVVAADLAPEACSSLNAACVARRRPLLWGKTTGCAGYAAVFAGHRTDGPCFNCMRPPLPPTGAHPDVLAVTTAAFIGTLLATEAIKILIGIEATRTQRMLIFDALETTVREGSVSKDPQCDTCGAVNRVEAVFG